MLGWTANAARAVVLCAAAGVFLFYVNRLFAELPLYAGDEGAYLIRALYGEQLRLDPGAYAELQRVENTAYFWVIRLVDSLSLNVIQWLRLLGAAAYFGGMVLIYDVARRAAGSREAAALLLVGLVFPYYRFVFSAMPEGLFVGCLCLMVWVLHRTYQSAPIRGALMLGVLAALLVLLKPNGLVAVIAFPLVAALETWLGRGSAARLTVRLACFLAAFFVAGVAAKLLAGVPLDHAMMFFWGDHYADQMNKAGERKLSAPVMAAAGMLAACAVFAAVPILAGLRDLSRRVVARTPLPADQLAFLFVALCLAGALSMVAIFAFKMSFNAGETKRIWGRYFEFYVPMLWILAAVPLRRWRGPEMRWVRILAAGAIIAGAVVLAVLFKLGVQLFPWDATAITAFAAPDAVAFPYEYLGGARLLAFAATAAAALATVLGAPLRETWVAFFVALGLLSTRADDAWVGEIAEQNQAMEHELHIVRYLAGERPTVVVAQTMNQGQIAFMRLQGDATVVLPDTAGRLPRITDYRHAVVFGTLALPPPWVNTYSGQTLRFYENPAKETRR